MTRMAAVFSNKGSLKGVGKKGKGSMPLREALTQAEVPEPEVPDFWPPAPTDVPPATEVVDSEASEPYAS